MISSGIVIFLAMLMIGFKLKPRTSLTLLGRPLLLDAIVTLLTLAIHFGTFSGIMAATFAGLLCSTFTSGARHVVGFIDAKGYTPGRWFDLTKLLNTKTQPART